MKLGRTALVMSFALAVALIAPRAWAGSRLKQRLTPTGKDPGARGRAALVIRGSNGRFMIAAKRLGGTADFEVIVDGVHVGSLSTGAGGSGKARFSTRPHGDDQLLGVDPRGKLVEVRDDEGDDVLEAEMPHDTAAGETRCCLTDDEETECRAETQARCAAKGGVDMGPGSCLPNPCAPTTPGVRVRCCMPEHDEDGPECKETTADACSAAGGVDIGAGECEDDDACAPTPPGAEEIRCCIPEHERDDEERQGDGDGEHEGPEPPDCERLTAPACAALVGTSFGPGSCEPNPCVASPIGAFLGAMIGLP